MICCCIYDAVEEDVACLIFETLEGREIAFVYIYLYEFERKYEI